MLENYVNSLQWRVTPANRLLCLRGVGREDIWAHEKTAKGIKLGVGGGGGGVTPYNDLYWEAPSNKSIFFTLQVYKRVGISQVEVCIKG